MNADSSQDSDPGSADSSPSKPSARDTLPTLPDGDETAFVTQPGTTPASSLGQRLEQAPERIGPYRIIESLGEGGMGMVYLAEQEEPVRRKVALKIIKLGLDTVEVVERFQAERQALAMMDHISIAKVYDAGATEVGRPFFVMEHVSGVSIVKYSDEHRLTTRQRIELFIRVCEAVQHAHQKGIIHRDLKPSNILVMTQDDRPVPKIIDFGVAKATNQRLTEKTLFTEHGVIIGTPEYMSPEQADLSSQDIDTRTDIYSLGVVLYELLVGCLPFSAEELRKAGYREMQRRIREEEPLRPSTRVTRANDVASARGSDPGVLSREIRGDLDWIVLKALEKDPMRRYATASELAADLQRHLRMEPVLATPPTFTYRLHKFVRRNRRVVAALLVVFLSLATALVVSFRWYLTARDSAADAVREAKAAKDARRDLELTLEKSRAAVAALYREKASRAEYRADHRAALVYSAVAIEQLDTPESREQLLHAWLAMPRQVWEVAVQDASSIAYHESGRVLVTKTQRTPEGPRSDLDFRDLHTGDRVSLLGGVQLWDAPRFRSTEGQLLVGAKGEVAVWQIDTAMRETLFGEELPEDARIAIGPRGMWAAASHEGATDLWDLQAGRVVKRVVGEVEDSRFFDPQGALVATTERQTVRVFDVASGEQLQQFESAAAPQNVRLSGDFLAVRTRNGNVEAWSREFGQEPVIQDLTATFRRRGDVQLLAGGKRLLARSTNALGLWDTESGQSLVWELAHDGVFVSDSGELLGWFDQDRSRVLVVRVEDGKEVFHRRGSGYQFLDFGADGSQVILASDDGVELWELESERRLESWSEEAVRSVRLHPDGDYVLVWSGAGSDQTVSLWDIGSRDLNNRGLALGPAESWVQGVLWLEDEKSLVAAVDQQLEFWPLDVGATQAAVGATQADFGAAQADLGSATEREALPAHEGPVYCLAVDDSGARWATGSSDQQVKIWDRSSRKIVQTLELAQNPVHCLAFQPAGGSAIAVGYGVGSLELRDAQDGSLLMGLVGHTSQVYDVAFGADGQELASVSQDGTVRLWNLRGQQVSEATLSQQGGRALDYHPRGRMIATGEEDGAVRIWTAPKLEELQRFSVSEAAISVVSFDPEGRWLYVGTSSGELSVWDLEGKERARLQLHQSAITSLAFAPDGTSVTTASRDRWIRVTPLKMVVASAADVLSVVEEETGLRLVGTELESTSNQ